MPQLNTRINLKHATLAEWLAGDFNKADSGKVLGKGEVAFVTVPTGENYKNPITNAVEPVVETLMKVGDGVSVFEQLPWASAKAADVYSWAKAATKPAYTAEEIEGLENFIAGEIQDTDTTYTFAEENGALVVRAFDKGSSTAKDTVTIDFVTPGEFTTLTDGKLHTEDQIKTIAATEIGRLIDAAGDVETLKSIGDLVDYAEKNAGDIANLVTRVGQAETNASNAVETANNANTTAGQANTTAGEAKELAQEAKEAAETAQNSAAASAEAAAGSASQAAASAGTAAADAATATQKASDAAGSATAASTSAQQAATAKGAAETAQSLAEGARDKSQEYAQVAMNKANEALGFSQTAGSAKEAALAAQAAAEEAQGKAEAAQAAAEEAKQAALDSNTSATAIANEAKTQAGNAVTTANTTEANLAKVIDGTTPVAKATDADTLDGYQAEYFTGAIKTAQDTADEAKQMAINISNSSLKQVYTLGDAGIKVGAFYQGTQEISIDTDAEWIFNCGGAN